MIEIERKFLVLGDAWRDLATRCDVMVQGYLAGPPAARCSIRVRIAGTEAFLNIKSISTGIEREEYEYAIPLAEAERMLATLAGQVIEKRRHHVMVEGHLFEIDEFAGDNQGLIVAEIELDRIDQPFPHPAWLGGEVSHLARYYNLHLAVHPYKNWSAAEQAAQELNPGLT